MHSNLRSAIKTPSTLCILALSLLVLAKFLWPLFAHDIPLGYDPGIYRYMFLRHAEGFPPFAIAEMDAWAHNHPLGLFFFSTILLKTGVPVGWLLGWIWNMFPVLLIAVFARITATREGKNVGVFVLLAGVLSVPLYDGFSAMYWKTFVALLFAIWAFYLIDKRSFFAIVPAFLTLVTHNQTGLLFALVIGTWWALQIARHRKNPAWRKATLFGLGAILLAALAYSPVWKQAIGDHIIPLLTMRGDNVPAGSFPPREFYLKMNGLLLLSGLYGLFLVVRRGQKVSLWLLAVLWSAAFVGLRLFFYRRFFLQLDFFLLPFAAIAMADIWRRTPEYLWRGMLIALVSAQAYLSYQVILLRQPDIDKETFEIIRSLEGTVPEEALVLTLENKSTTWLRGWLPANDVAGPGLFSLPWSREQWEQLLYGSHAEKQALLRLLPGEVYLLLTPLFYDFYGEQAHIFIADSCFEKVEGAPLLHVTCNTK